MVGWGKVGIINLFDQQRREKSGLLISAANNVFVRS